MCSAHYHLNIDGSGDCTADTCAPNSVETASGGCSDSIVEFISIPAGSFVLSHDTKNHSSGDTVTLNAFSLGKTPVTVAQFQKCVAAGRCDAENFDTVDDDDYCNYNRGNDWNNHPMNCVNLFGAREFCEWIGGRLPTEEEWEYAATHDGTTHLNRRYAFGDTLNHCVNAQYYDDGYCDGKTAAVSANGYQGTSDVSVHAPAGNSPLGLVDMTGNVDEWTEAGTTKGGAWNTNGDLFGYQLEVTDCRTDFSRTSEVNNGFRCAK